jgi:hypothetical protein
VEFERRKRAQGRHSLALLTVSAVLFVGAWLMDELWLGERVIGLGLSVGMLIHLVFYRCPRCQRFAYDARTDPGWGDCSDTLWACPRCHAGLRRAP